MNEEGYDSRLESLKTMQAVLEDTEEIDAAVLSLQFENGTGDVHFACSDDVDYWKHMKHMTAHRIEVMADRADTTVPEMLDDIRETIEFRDQIRNEGAIADE